MEKDFLSPYSITMIPINGIQKLKWIRGLLVFFIAGLAFSGLTAYPLVTEIGILNSLIGSGSIMKEIWPGMAEWISKVHTGITATDQIYPFLFYGTDWLAFAHLVIAVAFIGPWLDPVRNRWVITFGMIACASVIPTALFFGSLRGIPFYWQMIDCSFGVFGIMPLLLVWWYTRRLAVCEAAARS